TLPFLVNGCAVSLMRQYALQVVPVRLAASARALGATAARTASHIVPPAPRPGLAALAALAVIPACTAFVRPLPAPAASHPTVQVAIRQLQQSNYRADYAMLFTRTLIPILPLVVIFLAFGKQIIGGIMEGAVRQ